MTNERDLRLDSIRGLALCSITLSHLNFDAAMDLEFPRAHELCRSLRVRVGPRLLEDAGSRIFAWALVPPLLLSFVIRHQIFFDGSIANAVAAVTHRHDLDALRLLNFAAIAYLVARISQRHPSWFEWRWFAYLGQHSLRVFSFSVGAAYFGWSIVGDAGIAGQLLIGALVIASLTLPAWVHVRYRGRRAARAVSAG